MKFALFVFDLKNPRWVQVNGERETDKVEDIFKTMSKVFSDRSLTSVGAKTKHDTRPDTAPTLDNSDDSDDDDDDDMSSFHWEMMMMTGQSFLA